MAAHQPAAALYSAAGNKENASASAANDAPKTTELLHKGNLFGNFTSTAGALNLNAHS